MCILCRSLFVCLSFFFWSFCCLFFLGLGHLPTLLRYCTLLNMTAWLVCLADVLPSFMAYHLGCNTTNTEDATWTVYPFGATAFNLVFCCCSLFSFLCSALLIIVCPFVHFRVAIVLFVFLWSHICSVFVVLTIRTFPYSWFINRCATKVTRRMLLVEQKRLSSCPDLSHVRVA